MAFEIGDKLEVICTSKEKYVGTLNRICLGICEEYPTQASIILKDNVLPEQTYGHAHIFCCDIAEIKRYN